MKKLPIIHEVKVAAQSQLFRVESLQLEFSNGEQRIFERLASRGHGAVLVVPLIGPDRILMIREYAAGTERYELGFPKGKVDAGETLIEAANRELQEEVGYGAKNIQLIKTVSLAPGYMGHCTSLLLAQDLYPASLTGDEPEPLEVVEVRISELDELIQREEFSEGRSLLALYMVRDLLKK